MMMTPEPIEADRPSTDFRDRVFRAGKWAMGLQAADRALGLIRTVVLARLLAPDDIGLFAIAAMALQLLATFSMTGFYPALIHKQGIERADLDAVWTVHVLRGFLRAAVLWLAAPLIADFYQAPQIASLVRMISLLLILEGFCNIGTIHFSRDLQYHKFFLLSFGGSLADLATVVISALAVRNAWALAYGLLARHLFNLALSYRIHPFRPRPRLSARTLKPLMRFGMWVSLTGILFLIGRQAAGLVLGKAAGVEALGFYQMAFMIAQAAILDPVLAGAEVAFPALSRVQDAPGRFRFSALTLIGLSAAAVMPLCAFLLLAADDITLVLLGGTWAPIAPTLRVLSVAFMLTAAGALGNPILMGSGRPRAVFQAQLCRALCVLATVYPFSLHAGTSGAAFSVLLGGCGMLAVSACHVQRTIGLRSGEIRSLFLPPLLACGAAALAWGLAAAALGALRGPITAWPPAALGLKSAAGLAAYALAYRRCQSMNATGIDFSLLLSALRQKKNPAK